MAAKLILLFLSFSAFYNIFYYASVNGLHGLVDDCIASKKLPETNEPLRTIYTGFSKLDQVLAILTTFFWPIIHGSQPGLMLYMIALSGSFAASWILVTLRHGVRVTFGPRPPCKLLPLSPSSLRAI